MHIFHTAHSATDIIQLSPAESHHCARVLRLKPGQHIGFVDGRGGMGEAVLLEVSSRNTMASVIEKRQQPARPFHLHIAIAPTKNIDRFEWFLEKATECGIEEITPVFCKNSERKVIKPDRLHKILVAAMKQSQRAWLPLLNEAVMFRDFVKILDATTPGYIAHCATGQKTTLRDVYTPGSHALILIGPEGDFNAEEVQMAIDKGVQAISLGENRLRTETAALVACMGVNFLNGEI